MSKHSDSTEAITVLAVAIAKFPHLRICQLIVNATDRSDPFYVTDSQLASYLRAYISRHAPSEVK